MLHILHRHRAVLPFTAALLCLVFLAGCGAAAPAAGESRKAAAVHLRVA